MDLLKKLISSAKSDPSVEHYLSIRQVKLLLERTLTEDNERIIIIKGIGDKLDIDAEGFTNDEAILWLAKAEHRLQHEGIFHD